MNDRIIDPDCRDGKHAACVGGPCQCKCHVPGTDPTSVEVAVSAAPPLTPAMRGDLDLLMRPEVDARARQGTPNRRRRAAA